MFDAHGEPRSADIDILRHSMDSAFCQNVHKGVIDLQSYIKSGRYRAPSQGGDDVLPPSLHVPAKLSK